MSQGTGKELPSSSTSQNNQNLQNGNRMSTFHNSMGNGGPYNALVNRDFRQVNDGVNNFIMSDNLPQFQMFAHPTLNTNGERLKSQSQVFQQSSNYYHQPSSMIPANNFMQISIPPPPKLSSSVPPPPPPPPPPPTNLSSSIPPPPPPPPPDLPNNNVNDLHYNNNVKVVNSSHSLNNRAHDGTKTTGNVPHYLKSKTNSTTSVRANDKKQSTKNHTEIASNIKQSETSSSSKQTRKATTNNTIESKPTNSEKDVCSKRLPKENQKAPPTNKVNHQPQKITGLSKLLPGLFQNQNEKPTNNTVTTGTSNNKARSNSQSNSTTKTSTSLSTATENNISKKMAEKGPAPLIRLSSKDQKNTSSTKNKNNNKMSHENTVRNDVQKEPFNKEINTGTIPSNKNPPPISTNNTATSSSSFAATADHQQNQTLSNAASCHPPSEGKTTSSVTNKTDNKSKDASTNKNKAKQNKNTGNNPSRKRNIDDVSLNTKNCATNTASSSRAKKRRKSSNINTNNKKSVNKTSDKVSTKGSSILKKHPNSKGKNPVIDEAPVEDNAETVNKKDKGDSSSNSGTLKSDPIYEIDSAPRASLNGIWIIDKSRGDFSKRGYLKAMGIPDYLINHHESIEAAEDVAICIELSRRKASVREFYVRDKKETSRRARDTQLVNLGEEEELIFSDDMTKTKKHLSLMKSDSPLHIQITTSTSQDVNVTRIEQVISSCSANKKTHEVCSKEEEGSIMQTFTVFKDNQEMEHSTTRYLKPIILLP